MYTRKVRVVQCVNEHTKNGPEVANPPSSDTFVGSLGQSKKTEHFQPFSRMYSRIALRKERTMPVPADIRALRSLLRVPDRRAGHIQAGEYPPGLHDGARSLQAFRRRLDIKDAHPFRRYIAGRAACSLRYRLGRRRARTSIRRPRDHDERSAALRADHNFAPETAVRDVAGALRRHVDEDAFIGSRQTS